MAVTKIRGVNVADWNVVLTDVSYLAKKDDHVCIDSSAFITITLPANPAISDRVKITDVEGACLDFPCAVDPNGQLILKQSGNDTINLQYATVIYTYIGNIYGWIKEFVSVGL